MPEQLVHVKPSKARVAVAMLSRPAFWPDLFRRIRLNIGQSLMPAPMGQGRNAATAWAASICVDEAEAISRLGLEDQGAFSDRHADLVAEAVRIERESSETLGGGGGIDLIWRVCEGLQAKTALETGVAYGWSSLAILASISQRDGWLYSVDMPHPLLKDEGLTGAVVPASLRSRWTLIREPDHSGLGKALRRIETLDFIHDDSDKSYSGRAATYRRLWPRLRSGGIIMSDDIADNTAFRDFAAEVDTMPVVVFAEGSGLSGARYVGLLVKP
jgi:hypothetical protein